MAFECFVVIQLGINIAPYVSDCATVLIWLSPITRPIRALITAQYCLWVLQ